MMDEASESDLNGGSPGYGQPPPPPAPEEVTERSEVTLDSDEVPEVDADVQGGEDPAGESSYANGHSSHQGEEVQRGQGDDGGLQAASREGQQERHPSGVQSPRPSISMGVSTLFKEAPEDLPPVNIRPIPIGDYKTRSKLRFEVVTARVMEVNGKKHVAYTIMMKRAGAAHDPHPAMIERRYSDFCFIYECILRSFHPSILGDFLFPKKVIIGNFKAEVISERTDAFHKFLNLITSCDNLLYSDYFYSFLSSEEHNEAVSHLKLGRYAEATPLLQTIFYVREKLLSVASVHVLLCACELVACLSADVHAGALETRRRREDAFAFAQVASESFGHVFASNGPDDVTVAESLRIPFLKMALQLANELGQDGKPFERQLSELRYAGARLESAPSLLEVVRDRYIHRASHTSKIS